jgi:hypothetical protein
MAWHEGAIALSTLPPKAESRQGDSAIEADRLMLENLQTSLRTGACENACVEKLWHELRELRKLRELRFFETLRLRD